MPPRAANSHSASVGSRTPAQAQYACASSHDTCTTGCRSRPSSDDCGPSGVRHEAPSTSRHHGARATAWVGGKSSGSSPPNTNESPSRSASVTCPVAAANRAKSAFVTLWAAMANGETRMRRTGPSPSSG